MIDILQWYKNLHMSVMFKNIILPNNVENYYDYAAFKAAMFMYFKNK